ncbi:uncharacterized protein LOC129805203 [Phlebotomus papatasi]|uniref:uncharacterized protein LOC129805203 n=1 Tax=Phlebotomus papatasi TaxID=29031 RepID=UPI0024836D7A|nr:uncharacterized protein LOC129805203 [Phlebotomus papatasi]
MSLVKVRGGYKSTLTSITNFLESLEESPQALSQPDLRAELESKLVIIEKLQPKYRDVQRAIIAEKTTQEDKAQEEEDFVNFCQDCDDIEARLVKLITDLKLKQEKIDAATVRYSPTKMFELMREDRKSQEQVLERLMREQQNTLKTIVGEFANIVSEQAVSSTPSTPQTPPQGSVPAVKLEAITVPTFDGKYTKWTDFKSLFISIVHENPNLPDSQKFHYLRKALVGDATQSIEHIDVRGENYTEAWEAVQERFNNKMNIVSSYLDAFHKQPSVTTPSWEKLRKLHDTSKCILKSLKSIGVCITGWDPWIIFILTQKLDHETQSEWAKINTDPSELPTWERFDKFLSGRCRALEMCPSINTTSNVKKNSKNVVTNSKSSLAHMAAVDSTKELCTVCSKSSHKLYKCETFKSLPAVKRLSIVRNLNICVNCIADKHNLDQCKYPSCRHCKEKHNFWLHDAYEGGVEKSTAHNLQVQETTQAAPSQSVSREKESTVDGKNSIVNAGVGVTAQLKGRRVMIKTARILVYDVHNQPHVCRAFVDEGAQGDFISERLCGILGLKKYPINEVVNGLEYQQSSPRFAVEAKIASRLTMNPHKLWCRVVGRVSVDLPNWPIQEKDLSIPKGFDLADPLWFKTERIDILIGGFLLNEILYDKTHKLGEGLPCLKSSEFGWMLFGGWNVETPQNIACGVTTFARIEKTFKDFFESEEVGSDQTEKSLTEEQEEVEKLFVDTTIRTNEGQFEVHIPLKDEYKNLENNRDKALQMLKRADRQLDKDPELKVEVQNIFQEYKDEGIIEPVPDVDLDKPSYYAPYHFVVKRKAASTKVRPVFNFSSKSASGMSLNDVIKVGPVVQPDLLSSLWGLRRYAKAAVCDFVKMFLHVLVTPAHRDFQRFLLRDVPNGPIKDYRFRTLCFGNSASPHLATRSTIQLANDVGEKYPKAANVIKFHTYMDDCLFCAQTISELLEIQSQLIEMCATAKFKLSKWHSNATEILQAVNACSDDSQPVSLSDIEIPRWAASIQFAVQEQLHVFCDASKLAYGVVIYLVVQDSHGNQSAKMLTAKSKVSPIKEKTIPKLELCAAHLGARLLRRVQDSLKIDSNQCFCWTDAKVVLGQIFSNRSQEVFVRNRVKAIHEISVPIQWRYVPTQDNPADILSRGSTPERLASSSLWWNGPEWLVRGEDSWPEPYQQGGQEDPVILSVAVQRPADNMTKEHEFHEHILATASNWTNAKKLAALIMRHDFKEKFDEDKAIAAEFSFEELLTAENCLIKWDQQINLHEIYDGLKRSNFKGKKGPHICRQLRPFLDDKEVMRVGGRIQESEEDYDAIHPRIIPKGKLAEMIAKHEHIALLHAGPSALICSLRRKFWPLGGRYLVRKITHYCNVCYPFKVKLENQVMGNLPRPRVTLARAFRSVGIDFAGPFNIRVDLSSRTRTQKVYVCVFVCMGVKAVHLEVVSSMTTEAFIAAFRRFVSRRNVPAEVYTDNGRNFVGAAREFQRLLSQAISQREVRDSTVNLGVQWHFQPPSAPHHGGLYEAAVKSMKYHLKRVMGDVILNFEEFLTVINQIEGTLNSRPLTHLSEDPSDPLPLTPGHFLTLAPLNQLPDPDVTELRSNTLSRWQLCQKLYQHFTKRWQNEYLQTLQQRGKWTEVKKDLSVGDDVLLIEEGLVDPKWFKGQISKIYRGPDGHVRTVDISTEKGTFTRPITKIAKYPTEKIWGSKTPNSPRE